MRHIQGSDRAQSLPLPASVEDYVGQDNPVRAIEAFVDGFNLAEAGFVRAAAKETGRPGYHPGDLLKLYLYGYLNRVRSSRRLEAECHRNLEVIWLLRGLRRPDFKTIADFRRENAPAFKAAFRHFVVLYRKLDLFGRELLAIDGTRLKAVNSTERNFTREKLKTMRKNADARLAGYLTELSKMDDQEGGPSAGTSPVKNLAEKIDSTRAGGKLIFHIFASLAEFERALIRERTLAGWLPHGLVAVSAEGPRTRTPASKPWPCRCWQTLPTA